MLTVLLASILSLAPASGRFSGKSDGSAQGGVWTPGGAFVVTNGLAEAVRVDLAFEIADVGELEPETPCEGAAGLVPVRLDDGAYGFWCWGDGRWQVLPFELNETAESIAARVELRDLGETTYVSYFVRTVEGYVQLATSAGRAWFRGSVRSATEHWLKVSEASGSYAFAGYDAEISTNGCTLTTYPGTGVTTIGSESAETTDLVVLTEEGLDPVVIGGAVRPSVSLDVSRPQAGVALEAAFSGETFLGLKMPCSFRWTRMDWDGSNAEVVSESTRYVPSAGDYAHWLAFASADSEGMLAKERIYFSKLPVCYVTTDDGLFPSAQKEEHAAVVRLQGNGEFKEQYNGSASIKVRGNTSAGYPKKPYKLKLDKKATLCGLGAKKSKHWVLLANMPDMSNLRNKLAFDFAREHAGVLGMKSTWVDVVVNGRFDGLYQLAEHIRVAEDRVDVFDWEGYSEDSGHAAEDLSWIDAAATDVNGGWIFEFSNEMDEVSRFTVKSGKLSVPTMVNAPEFLKTNGAMFNAAQTHLKNYFDACTSANRRSGEGLGYAAYCDVDSMVGYFLVQELFGNQDAGAKSRYAYKDLGGRLTFGPVWDFDHAAGTTNMQNPSPARWHAAQGSFYAEWLSDYRFARRARARYRAIRDAYSALASDGGAIDRGVAYLRESAAANDARWPQSRTFAEDVDALKRFIEGHRAWLDTQFETLETLIESTRCDAQTNPCNLADIKPEGLVFSLY